jgi:dynactin complex subunit
VAGSSLQVLLQVMRETHNEVRKIVVSNAVLTEKVDNLERAVEKLEQLAERLETREDSKPRKPRSFARDAAAGGSGALLIAALQALQAFLAQPPAVKAPPAPATIVQPK